MTYTDQNEKAIFNSARQMRAAAREDYLNRVCGPDLELKRRVQVLLNLYQERDSFLETPLALVDNQIADTLLELEVHKPGDEIGPYRLMQQIGDGGMGSVWMAEQREPVRRQVALKLIKTGLDSRQVIARFAAEWQALSLMDHPNVARVLDAGTSNSGHPYFVMELVKGQAITDYCTERQLTLCQRLELFQSVCQAVQHAHQKGIIHRDIKPSNVLVTELDGQPVAKLIDFGVAKALHQPLTEQTMFTGLGQIIGTLEYMSPEQARINQLDIDTRSDIYSLGVLLYELLTGSTPFDRQRMREAPLDEMLRIIREEEPAKPSARLNDIRRIPGKDPREGIQIARLSSLIRGDLDWIVMKAIEKDRNRRFDTVAALMNDVQSYLNHQPVAAAPPSIGYRLRKFMRRNQLSVAAASLIAMVLVAAIVGTAWSLIEARRQASRAQTELLEKEKAREAALAERRLAMEFRNRALEALRATTGSDIALLLAERQTLGPNERSYLEAIASRWQIFAQLEGEDQHTRAVRGEGHYRLGSLLLRLGQSKEASAGYQEAVAIYEALVVDFPDVVDYRVELATCHVNLGSLMHSMGKVGEAEQHFNSALAMHEALVKASPDNANNAKSRDGLANSHNNLALLLTEVGRYPEAEQHYQDGLGIFTRLVEGFLDSSDYLRGLARCQNNYGLLMSQLGQVSKAEDLYRQAIANYEQLNLATPESPIYRNELAWSNRNLGILLADKGNAKSAIEHYIAAIEILETLAVDFRAVPEYRLDLAANLDGLAVVLADEGQTEEAKSRYEQSLAILQPLASEFTTLPEIRFQLARTSNNLGVLLLITHQLEDAERQCRLAADELTEITERFTDVPKYLQELARSCNNLGVLFAKEQNFAEADSWHLRAVETQQRLADQFPNVPAYRVDLGGSYCNFANLQRDRGRPEDSLPWYEQAINQLSMVFSENPSHATANRFLRNAHSGRAVAFQMLSKLDEALHDWNRAIELTELAEQVVYRAARAVVLAHLGQIDSAVDEVTELASSDHWNAVYWYNFACVFSIASRTVDDKRQEYSDRAVTLLQKSVDAGWRDASHFKEDADLEPLRNREDFQKLIDSIEEAARSQSTPSGVSIE